MSPNFPLSLNCLLHLAEARQLPWCNVKTIDGSRSKSSKNTRRGRSRSSATRVFALWKLSIDQHRSSTSPMSNENSSTLACHINVFRSTDSGVVELQISGSNIEIYHNGPLKGPSNDTSKKRCFVFIRIGSPKKMQTVSALSQSSRLDSLQNKTTEDPTANPYSHHVATDRTLQRTGYKSFTRSAQWRRATELCPLRLASRSTSLIYLCVTWRKRLDHCRHHTQCERSHTGTDFVGVRRRRSRFGAAFHYLCDSFQFNCIQFNSILFFF